MKSNLNKFPLGQEIRVFRKPQTDGKQNVWKK
jgi:hypothetical protein